MVVFPNAKINLGLNITERRSDGYHNLETVMLPVGWCDILEIVPSRGDKTTLTVSGNHVDCPMDKNLVIKAYKALSERVHLPAVDIYLRKIIPDGAGLGGGSSDASFTLKALNTMFSLGMDDTILAEIASEIGADCPFFIYNRPMMATGIGTEFRAVDIPDLENLNIIIMKPAVSVPTKEAYAGVIPSPWNRSLSELLDAPCEFWQGNVINDFECSIFPGHPEIARLKQILLDAGAVYASMSGSGSAVYGLFRKGDIMSEINDEVAPGCRIYRGTIM